MTLQEAIDKWRIQLGETDKQNSRWDDDPHGKYYVNLGRREWAKKSKALKSLFEQTTTVGPTVGLLARYTLDPRVYKIDEVFYDGEEHEIDIVNPKSWSERLNGRRTDLEGIPEMGRRKGDVLDIWPAPAEEKNLSIYATILPADLSDLGLQDPDLNDDQLQGAIYYGVFQALTDDDRDGTIYENKFLQHARDYREQRNQKGPRRVVSTRSRWPA